MSTRKPARRRARITYELHLAGYCPECHRLYQAIYQLPDGDQWLCSICRQNGKLVELVPLSPEVDAAYRIGGLVAACEVMLAQHKNDPVFGVTGEGQEAWIVRSSRGYSPLHGRRRGSR